MDPVICARKSSGCMEEEYNKGVRIRGDRIQDSRRIFDKFKKRIWWRRKGVRKGSRVKEVGARGENNGRICVGVQESGERK